MNRIAALVVLAFQYLPMHAVTIVVSVVQNPTCTSINGNIDVSIVGGTPPYAFAWSDGATTEDRTGLPPGSYTLTVTDGNQDQDQETVVLVADPFLDMGAWSYQVDGVPQWPCPDGELGQACAPLYPNQLSGWYQGVNGVAPMSVSFFVNGVPASPTGTDAVGNPYITGLAFGDQVSYTVTDAAGCTNQPFPSTVSGPLPGALAVASISDACNGGANGSILFADVNGFAGFAGWLKVYDDQMNFVLSTPQFQNPIQVTGLLPGTYNVEVLYGFGPLPICSNEFLPPITVGDLGPNCGTVQGTLFLDNDQDCIQDAGEVPVPFNLIEILPGPHYAITDANGHYERQLTNGAYTLEPAGTGTQLHPLCPALMPAPFTIASNTVGLDLADSSLTMLDVLAYCASGAARPGFVHHVYTGAINTSGQLSGALEFVLTFDAAMGYISAVPAPTTVSGNVLTWSAPGLGAYGTFPVEVLLQVPPDPQMLGQPFAHAAACTQPLPETSTANNTVAEQGVYTGSYDPNDKIAFTSSGNSEQLYFIGTDTHIDYRIRFQNTGTATAFTVVVTDTLPVELDLATFQQGPASHPFGVTFKTGRVVEWRFENILLPDSGTNEPASHGLVQFRLAPVAPVLPGTVYRNNADIFFDFNPPVRTNDAVLVAETSTLVQEHARVLGVFPVPAHDRLVLRLPQGERALTVRILSGDGRLVHAAGAVQEVDVHALAAGHYVVRVHVASGRMLQASFVKQ